MPLTFDTVVRKTTKEDQKLAFCIKDEVIG
jgi:hypothetical protein